MKNYIYPNELKKLPIPEITREEQQKIVELDIKISEQLRNIDEIIKQKEERHYLFIQDTIDFPVLIEANKDNERQEISIRTALQKELQRKVNELNRLETTSEFRVAEREIRNKRK